MRVHIFIFVWLLQLSSLSAIGQPKKESNLLKKYEIRLLDILTADSVDDLNFTIPDYHFTFGITKNLFTDIQVIRHKRMLFLQPLGTGRIYKVHKNQHNYKLERIDSTIHTGATFFSANVFVRDTLFQYGGTGFWNLRGIITYYSNETHQWEIYQTNKEVSSMFEGTQGALFIVDTALLAPKLFITNSYVYSNFPKSFNVEQIDSCYQFDFNNRAWTTLGILSNDFIKKKNFRNSQTFQLGDYILFNSQLEYYWANPNVNKYGKFKTTKDEELRQSWLEIYKSTNLKSVSTPFQFIIGNTIYFLILNNDELLMKKNTVNVSDFDLNNANSIYIPSNSYFRNALSQWEKYKFSSILILFAIVLLFILIAYLKKRNKIPTEVKSILNQHFFNALSITEKELINVLYQHQLRGEELSTKLINKIIGVQQKDTLTQNKMRSDYFIRINQKYKLATQQQDPIIVKKRDALDKRQYNYSLNPNYLEAIEHSIKGG